VHRLVTRSRRPFPLVGEGEDGGAGGGAPPPHLNPPPPGGRRIADAAGQETRESDRALILEFQQTVASCTALGLRAPSPAIHCAFACDLQNATWRQRCHAPQGHHKPYTWGPRRRTLQGRRLWSQVGRSQPHQARDIMPVFPFGCHAALSPLCAPRASSATAMPKWTLCLSEKPQGSMKTARVG
jgi:hypothetical protein